MSTRVHRRQRLHWSHGDATERWAIASQFAVVFEAIKQLIAAPAPSKKQIGFHP